MTQTQLRVDGVFEGGGVKGIALVGAASEIEAAGYEIVNLAGTSAGAIVATLLAAGYSVVS
jgi:NTE family protein